MKITDVTTVTSTDFPNLVHVQVGTDEGLTGLGESFYAGRSVAYYVHDVAAGLVLGQDPFQRDRISRSLEGYVGYSGSGIENRARSAIDIALWDIVGQAAAMPLFDLLGGRTQDDLRAYNTCAGSHYVRADGQAVSSWGLDRAKGQFEDLEAAINDAGALAEDLLASGITAMKIWPFDTAAERSQGRSITTADLKTALAPIESIRNAVGDSMDIMIELHALWMPGAARQIVRALNDYDIFWVEDPIRSDFVPELADLRETTGIPIAIGETLTGKPHFANVVASGAADILTLDIGWTGGITEAQKIAALAEAHGVLIAPHDCTGPVGLAVATHLSTASRQALIQETVRASYYGWYPSIAEGGPILDGGVIRPSDTPGNGVRLTESHLTAATTEVRVTTLSR